MLVDPMDNCGQQGIPVSFSTDGCHDSGQCSLRSVLVSNIAGILHRSKWDIFQIFPVPADKSLEGKLELLGW